MVISLEMINTEKIVSSPGNHEFSKNHEFFKNGKFFLKW